MKRITPDNIVSLEPSQVFVFGSNCAGKHGKGAALTAKKWGANSSVAAGRSGQTYAIPTKDHRFWMLHDRRTVLGLAHIGSYVEQFIQHARENPQDVFLVTEIGCGLAGYEPKDIAPLFGGAVELENVWLPRRFWDVLEVADNIICRGCYAFGTACGECSRCRVERATSEFSKG